MSHTRKVCSCGTVISQCRCPGPHPTKIIPFGCGRCAQYQKQCRPHCEDCGKSICDFLTITESFACHGYASSSCFTCQLTDSPRVIPASV